MTLRREPKTREIVFDCDGADCTSEIATGSDDFEEARAELRTEGWSTLRRSEDWAHFCADCRPAPAARSRYVED